jgi:hypothetical protein
LQITDENQVKILVKFIHDINQHLKSIYGNEEYYNYENGTIVCNGKGQVTPYVTVEPVYTKKNSELKDIIDNVSFSIYGVQFFQFHKEYKNNINRIIIEDNYIHFLTDLPLVELIFPKTNQNNKAFNNNYELLDAFKLSESQSIMINDLGNSPFTLYLDFDNRTTYVNKEPEGNYLQFTFNKKFLVGFKSTKTFTSGLYLNVFDYDSDGSLYLIELGVKSKEINVKQYMVITDVLIDEE